MGPEPLSLLFDRLKGCTAAAETAGAWWRGLRTVAWDGTTLEVADSAANAAFFGYYRARRESTYPLLRLTALVECGTRALVDAVAGPVSTSEKSQAQQLCAALLPSMLHLADRGSDGLELMLQAARTGAHLLWRVNAGRLLPAIEVLDDGSWLSMVSTSTGRNQLVRWVHRDRRRGVAAQAQGVAVRVIEADITVTDRATRHHPFQQPAPGHHAAGPPALPGPGARRALPRALGDRDQLLRTQGHHAGLGNRSALPSPP